MEGKRVLLLGAVSLALLVVIVVMFLSMRGAPYVPPSTTTQQQVTTTSPQYNVSSVPTTTVSPTTTIPANATPAWQRLNGDLGAFANVSPITLTYDISKPHSQYGNGTSVTVYRLGGNYSFDTVWTLQNFSLPARAYPLNGTDAVCANLPFASFNATLSCAALDIGFPDPVALLSLNASAYSNVTYIGVKSVNGESCDSFTANVSAAESERLDNSSSGQSFASLCVNPTYGYPDYYSLEGGATYTWNGTFPGISDASSVAVPAAFGVQGASCGTGQITMNITPFTEMANPTFTLEVNAQNSTAVGLYTALETAETQLMFDIFSNATLYAEAYNSTDSAAFAASYYQTRLSNMSYDGYSLWDAYLQFNSTNNTVASYANVTFNDTLGGTFSPLQQYTVSLPVENMSLFQGFAVCYAGTCQEVYRCQAVNTTD